MMPAIETASTAAIKDLQERELQKVLIYVAEKSPFYRRHFAEKGVDISTVKKLADLCLLPVTTKEDLQLHNDDFLCVPIHEIVDFACTSGTLGEPVTFGLTEHDLERLAYNEAISLDCAGIESGDLVQLMVTIDRRFMAGLAYFLGLRKIKAGVLRVGAGIPELQWDSILKYKPTYLITIPSFLLKLIEYAEINCIDYKNCGIKGAICIGEPVRKPDFTLNALSSKISEKWNIRLFSTYASTEMSTAFTECDAQQGGHHHPELVIIEVLDENNDPVSSGEPGELVFTTLGVEAMPLIRFKTGDIVQVHESKCTCGRNTSRVGPIIGRKKQMIKYKGTTLYPPSMIDILNNFDNIENYRIEIFNSEVDTDEILLRLVVKEMSDTFMTEIRDHFRAKLRVTPKIEFTDHASLASDPLSRKPVLFIDHRKTKF